MSHEALRQALAEWRQAEQRLVDATPGSPEWADARDAERRLAETQRGSPEWFAIRFQTIRLRDEYARALDAAMRERQD